MILYTFDLKKEKIESNKLLEVCLRDYCRRKSIGIPCEGFIISKIRNGKPELSNIKDVNFSISHTKDLFVCGVQDKELGLDIEDMKLKEKREFSRYESIAKRFFEVEEQAYVQAKGLSGFFEIWTRKEAYIKAKATGISEGLNSFSVIENMCFKSKLGDYLLSSIIPFIKEQNEIEDARILGAYCSKIPLIIEEIIKIEEMRGKSERA